MCRRYGTADLSSDPVRYPHRHKDPRDAEVAAFLAASFAFGRVSQIHRFLDALFPVLSPAPWEALTRSRPVPFRRVEGLSHRFVSSRGVFLLLRCLRQVLRERGSLEGLYRAVAAEAPDLRSGLAAFLGRFRRAWGEELPRERNFLFPDPRGGSACKRHNLFLRWMVRRADGVDLGLWSALSPADLVVPLDTHLARLGRWMGLTRRRSADWKTAGEITAAFRSVCPEDPVRFDFALTRVGILGECTARRRGRCPACPLARVCAGSGRRRGAAGGEFAVAVPSPLG